MSQFAYPDYGYDQRRRRAPIPNPSFQSGPAYLDEAPIYGDTSAPRAQRAPAPIPLPVPQQPQPHQPGYFDLQNQRSDRQRTQTIRNNANNAASAATFAQNAPLPTDPYARAGRAAYVQRQQGRADQLNDQIDGPRPQMIPLPVATTGRQPAFKPVNPKDRATAFREYTLGGMTPEDATKRIDTEFAAAGQQGPNAAAPATAQPPLPQIPPAGPAAVGSGKSGIAMTEQIAREMLRALTTINPNVPYEHIKPQFVSTVGQYGADGNMLWDKWTREGSLGRFDYPTGQTQMLPAQPRVDAAPNPQTGSGGMVTLPNGQQVVVNSTGRRVGDAIAQGPPLPTTQLPVMGAQPGFTPVNSIPVPPGSESTAGGGYGHPHQVQPALPLPTLAAAQAPPQQPQPQQAPQPQAQAQPASPLQQQPKPLMRTIGDMGGAPSAQQYPRVSSAEQYHALASGSMYYDPSGNLRRKQ